MRQAKKWNKNKESCVFKLRYEVLIIANNCKQKRIKRNWQKQSKRERERCKNKYKKKVFLCYFYWLTRAREHVQQKKHIHTESKEIESKILWHKWQPTLYKCIEEIRHNTNQIVSGRTKKQKGKKCETKEHEKTTVAFKLNGKCRKRKQNTHTYIHGHSTWTLTKTNRLKNSWKKWHTRTRTKYILIHTGSVEEKGDKQGRTK